MAAGALFIPSLALALGVWSDSSKLFEALYTVWWYVGPLHQVPSLDFVGGSRASSSPGLYLILAAGLLLASYSGGDARLPMRERPTSCGHQFNRPGVKNASRAGEMVSIVILRFHFSGAGDQR